MLRTCRPGPIPTSITSRIFISGVPAALPVRMQHSGSLAIPCLPIRLILMARLARMGSTRRHVRPRRERQPTTAQQHEDARVWFLLAVSSAGSGSFPRTALPTTPASTPQPTVGTILEHLRAAEPRSEEHTSELQSPCNLVCRLLLE